MIYILGCFPILERRDRAEYGDYRTMLLVLDVFESAAKGHRRRGAIPDAPRSSSGRLARRVLPQLTVGVLSLTYLHARVWAVV